MEISYPFASPPGTGDPLEVAPGILWLRMPLPFALDHINLWLLKDGAGWTAVDTGISRETIRLAWDRILENRRLTRQIVTHFHPDHLGLAAWLEKKTGAPLWMTQGEYTVAQLVLHQIAGYGVPAMLEFFAGHGLGREPLDELERRGNAFARGVPEIPGNYHRMIHGDRIAVDGQDWRVMVGHGHAPEHASLYCAGKGVLISGDMLLPRISTNISAYAAKPFGDPLGRFLESITAYLDLPDDTLVLPSHGLPFFGIRARVAQLRAHHQARCDELLAACADTPLSAAELIPVMFPRPILDAHQMMFAIGEAVAHLLYLEHRGHMARAETDGIIRFRSVPPALAD
ncbi:MAG: MBL fold metallo-hydrolase [Rhodocyclaceae bacterium]|nr:MBL fold metallo-hydrolase [Rhodocyclaceae bacterium]